MWLENWHEVPMLLPVAAALMLAAQPSSPWLDEARVLVEQLRFADAIKRLEVARKVRSLDPIELREVMELLAYCQVAEGRRDAAEATFTAMLQADPRLELSRESSSPKVLEVLEAAKRRLFPPDYVRLEEKPSAGGWVALTLLDPWSQVTAVTLVERRDGGEWIETELSEEIGHVFRFPLKVSVGDQLDWYVEARGEAGVVAHVATRAEPRVLKVARQDPVTVIVPPAPKPIQGVRVAGLVTVGVGLLLGAVATGLAVSGSSMRGQARTPSRPPGDFADTARAAEREGQIQQNWATGLFIGAGASVATGVVLAW